MVNVFFFLETQWITHRVSDQFSLTPWPGNNRPINHIMENISRRPLHKNMTDD